MNDESESLWEEAVVVYLDLSCRLTLCVCIYACIHVNYGGMTVQSTARFAA
jgi:hypothetical protein